MRKVFMLIFTVVLGIVFLIGGQPSVYAQETDYDEFTLEEITVTAQKREENTQKVPIAMQVISAEEIKELGKNNLFEMLSSVSSLIIQKADDSVAISARGVSDTIGGGGQPSLSINIDGVTSNRRDTGTGMYDIERVEVLLGPQSTLYATASPGGVINVINASPKIDRYEASGSLEYGNFNLLHTEGAMNAPLGDTMALRAAFSTSVRDGYLSNGGEDEDSKSGRVKFLFKPNDRISAEITAELFNEGGNGYYGGVPSFANQDDVDNPWTGATFASLGYNDRDRKKIYANINWAMDLGTLTLTPARTKTYGEREQMASVGPPGMSADYSAQLRKDHIHENEFEVRMVSAEDFMFNWNVGYIWLEGKEGLIEVSDEYRETGVGQWANRVVYDTVTTLYGNITYPVTNHLRLTAGARRNDNAYDYDQEMSMLDRESGEYVYRRTIQKMDSPAPWDYRVGFEYDIGENSMAYGNYASSYRIVRKYRGLSKPENISAFTVGAKNRFFENKLQLNGAAYYYEYENYMTYTMISAWLVDLDGDFAVDRNETEDDSGAAQQGSGKMMGFDLDASAVITPQDRLDVSISYLESEWTDLFFDYDYNTVLDVVDGQYVWVDFPDKSYNGQPMFMSPPWTISATYNHNFNLANGGILTARLEARYQTAYKLTWLEDDYPKNYQETHHLANISAIYANPDGKWTLSGYIRNVFNYAEKLRYRSGRGYDTLWISDPRTYGVVLTVKY
jgi:iron complex outermembrane receptor protein